MHKNITPRPWHHKPGDSVQLVLDKKHYEITGTDGKHYILNGQVRAAWDCAVSVPESEYWKWWSDHGRHARQN